MKMDKKTGSNEHACGMCGSSTSHYGTIMALLGLGAAVLGVLLLWGKYPWFTLTNVAGIALVVKGLKKFVLGLHHRCA